MSQEEKDNIIKLFKDSVPNTPSGNNVTGDGNIVGNGFVMINVYHEMPSTEKRKKQKKKREHLLSLRRFENLLKNWRLSKPINMETKVVLEKNGTEQ